ncbi:hypothetical protein OEA41_009038 [Lepraria neglecta]|uniref:Heterokaryon incompatibility domain-containing protein n=1 Tax=Lepraria neglecta TaxID=209136 RepID=A0AAD9Z176_9LECA|nr:hypothetical protein OEA41_009038 [Lepraria neglecta]
MNSFNASFRYGSRLANRQIRLLHVKSGPHPDSIEIELSSSSLDSETQYCALSYVWRDANATKEVLWDGQLIRIREGLFGALGQHLATEPEQLLWADALCINQQDDEEKTAQVKMMGQIYRAAVTTVVWLGSECEGDARAVRLLVEVWQKFPTE